MYFKIFCSFRIYKQWNQDLTKSGEKIGFKRNRLKILLKSWFYELFPHFAYFDFWVTSRLLRYLWKYLTNLKDIHTIGKVRFYAVFWALRYDQKCKSCFLGQSLPCIEMKNTLTSLSPRTIKIFFSNMHWNENHFDLIESIGLKNNLFFY